MSPKPSLSGPFPVLLVSGFTVQILLLAAARQDRLATLEAVRAAGISVCAGGIIGLGEGPTDRVGLLHQLATLREHPESVPINALARTRCFHARFLRAVGLLTPTTLMFLGGEPANTARLLHQLATLRRRPVFGPINALAPPGASAMHRESWRAFLASLKAGPVCYLLAGHAQCQNATASPVGLRARACMRMHMLEDVLGMQKQMFWSTCHAAAGRACQ